MTNPVAHPTAAAIAADIRAELVCCDIYDRVQPVLEAANRAGVWAEVTAAAIGGHEVCFWGEAAARIAETHAPDRAEPTG